MKTGKSLSKKLEEYMTMKSSQQKTFKAIKGSLMMLAPFAASTVLPTALQSQSCGAYTGGVVLNSSTFNGCPDNYIDIDGDGSADFNLFLGSFTNPILNAVNGAVLGNTASGFNYAGNASGTFTAGGYSSFTAASITYPAYGNGNFPLPSGGFIPILFNGNLGWIEVTLDAAGCATIGSFGVESADGGTDGVGTVVAGDCNTLNATLPVELGEMKVSSKDANLILTWTTHSEINNHGFEVQRSFDGKKFVKVDFIKGSGTSSQINNYNFIDKNVKSNQMYYYRLKQVDYDGRFEITKMVSAKVESDLVSEVYDIFPNPSNNKAELSLLLKVEQLIQVTIYNQVGKICSQDEHYLKAGNSNINLDVEKLNSGIYYVKTDINSESFYRKLIVE